MFFACWIFILFIAEFVYLMMEYNNLLKHIAELEARFLALEAYVNEISKLNKNLILPEKKRIDFELEDQRRISKMKYLS